MIYLTLKLSIAVLVLAVAGFSAIKGAHHRAEIRAKMLAAPATFDDNELVTLTGKAKLVGQPLAAPLSGKPCIAFRATARTFKRVGRMRTLDQEVHEILMTSFVLVTAQGDVHVDGDVCEMPLRGAPIIPRQMDRERAFMRKVELYGPTQEAGFDEVIIPEGAKIKVHGIARKELATGGGETGFRDAAVRIRITGDAKNPIAIDLA